MKKLSFFIALFSFLSLVSQAQKPLSVAHRGCHIDGLVPENSLAGVEMAKRFGFRAIECDVHYTSDSIMILMHDKTINRTMRNASDYSVISDPVNYSDLTFEELRRNYVLASSDSDLRTPIPSFAEELEACKKYGIIPVIHTNIPEAFDAAKAVLGDGFVAFNSNFDILRHAREISSCLILWDPGKTKAKKAVAQLKELGGRCGISTMKYDMLNASYIKKIRAAGFEVQSSIFPTPHEMEAINDGASIILSDFSLLTDRENRKAFLEQSFGERIMKKDETAVFEWPETELGSLEICIEYNGRLELLVNGERQYVLPVGKHSTRIAGWRFHNCAPSLKITAHGNASFKLDAAVFKY